MSETPFVTVLTPLYGEPSAEFAWSRTQLLAYRASTTPRHTKIQEIRDYPVETARNELTRLALLDEPRATHFLWIDGDMEFPADALDRLLAHNLPIVGGLCHNRRPPAYQPVLGRRPDPVFGFPPDHYAFVYDWPPGAVIDVDVTGGAFLLVERRVFEDIAERFGTKENPTPWWDPGFLHPTLSEDFSFCERARACGYQVRVDTSLEIGHCAKVVIRSAEAKRLRTAEWGRWHTREYHDAAFASRGAPQVSVVIPTYNTPPEFLKAAVHSALAQTVPVEVIVVDDGSDKPVLKNDMADDVFRRTTIVPHLQNRGISAALNTGISAATTDWICWLSADDILDPRKVERQLAATLAAGCRASFTRFETVDQTGRALWRQWSMPYEWRSRDEQNRMLAQGCCINGSTTMIQRSVFDDVGLYDEAFRYGQDWQMWRRIGAKYDWLFVPEILCVRREGQNLTAAINTAPIDDERRKRRDLEDAMIRAMVMP